MNMNKWLGTGGVLLAVITGASIWLSVAVPRTQMRAAQSETSHALSLAKEVLASAGTRCALTHAEDQGLAATSAGIPGSCTVVVVFSDSAFVLPILRGVHMQLAVKNKQSLCTAVGGHGASVADFPQNCRYRSKAMLL